MRAGAGTCAGDRTGPGQRSTRLRRTRLSSPQLVHNELPPRPEPDPNDVSPAITEHDARPLRDHVVLITGGAQGIGRGIAQAVLGAGGSVLIGDLDAVAGRACLDEWRVGRRAAFGRMDVSREASVQRWVAAARKRFGRIDGLVNNAGIADPHSGKLTDLSLADWNRYLASNLTRAFLCSKHALPALTQARGGIVNIASTRALQSEPDTEAHAASKGGLLALTHAMAISAGPDVRVNAILPGWIATDDWRRPAARHAPQLSRLDHAQHPVGRAGTPEDIGALVVYLLGASSGFITGQHFVVDGGRSVRMHYV
jgi:NAD(P)-dependent dehydrogenase (short-subunit alcohol dehydrogenase family)